MKKTSVQFLSEGPPCADIFASWKINKTGNHLLVIFLLCELQGLAYSVWVYIHNCWWNKIRLPLQLYYSGFNFCRKQRLSQFLPEIFKQKIFLLSLIRVLSVLLVLTRSRRLSEVTRHKPTIPLYLSFSHFNRLPLLV